MYTTHFIENGALQTAYYDLSKGTPFLLVHGFTGSKLDFLSQLAWFVEDHRVLAYDQRGHGETSNIKPYTLEQLAADLLGFLDALEIPSCHVLGHSMGGMVVLRALLDAPERFQSLILMDTAAEGLSLFDADMRARLNAMVMDGGCEALLTGMRGQPQSAPIQRGIDFLGEAEHWRRIEVKLNQMDPEAFVALGHALSDQPSQKSRLSEISVPTTVIAGEYDAPFVPAAREMHQRIEDSRLAIIPDAAHSPQYENADVWRDEILRHFADLRSA